ncbi:MAG: DUF11 domain-containing protein [Pseudomonadota bacterium]|nr:DUF11 domain-containing protein [Pseudomonadota bacterium]
MKDLKSQLFRLISLLALALGISQCAQAATTIYGIRGTATAGANDIIRLDPATGAFTPVYDNYPGGNAATIAQCPNGLIYYAINAGVNQLYVFNPQTPAVAPATLGAGLPDGGLKMACSPGGVLYYLTEAATNNLRIISTVTGTYTGAAVTITGAGAGGDIAFNSTGTLYGFNNTWTLFTIPLAGGAVTPVGSGPITGLTNPGIGLAFTDTDGIRVLTTGAPGFFSVNTGTNPPSATSLSSPPGGAATGDLASINVPNPDLSITKTANVANVASGVATAVVYTIVVTNSSAYPVTGTVTDTFPAGVSAVTWACTATAGSACAAAAGAGNINTTARLAPGGSATYTVSATVTATAPVVNTANVALPFTFLTDATPANNTATNTIQIRPAVTKTFGAPSFGAAGNTSLTISIANVNGAAITTNEVFTDTLPTVPGPMTINTAGSTGTCPNVTAAAGSGNVTMASGTVIPAGGCTIIVNVTATALGTYTNTIAAGALVTSAGNNPNAASANVNVVAVPTIAKAFSPATIASGGTSTLTITLSNSTVGAYTAATFTDTFPVAPGAMTVAAPLTTSNTCGGTLQDSSGGALAPGDVAIRLTGGTIPALGSCVITVRVTAAAAGVYTNTIPVGALTTSGGSNTVTANATLTVALPSFTVAKSVLLVSDPVNGTTLPKAIPGAVVSYSIQVTNTGAGTADNNTTFIVDPIPANTRLFVGDLGVAGSGPIAFVNGTPTSSLTYTFTSLASGADDVSFSNTGCSPFTNYTPVPDVNGFDAAVTCIQINPKGMFAAASGGNNPNFEARFRVQVN